MAAWSSTTHYAIRDTASSGGLLYIALVPNINVVPGSDRTTWILFASPPSPVVEVAMVGDGAVYEVAVPGSPVQFEGTFAPALVPQAAHTVLAGPTSGGSATPSFRALVAGDIPGGGGGSALTDSHILVGNASNVATDVAMSGDAAISNTGAVTVSKSGGVAFGSAAFVGTGTFDLAGAASTAQTNAEAFAANASNISSGTIGAGFLPLGSAAAFGAFKVDGTTITAAAGVLSAVSSGSGGGGAASIQDDGTNLYVAMSDADGQLIVDGSGDPIFVKEVLPANAIPSVGNPAMMAIANFRF